MEYGLRGLFHGVLLKGPGRTFLTRVPLLNLSSVNIKILLVSELWLFVCFVLMGFCFINLGLWSNLCVSVLQL